MLSRRSFVTGSMGLLASVELLPVLAAARGRVLQRAQFEALLGSSFSVFGANGRPAYCDLVEVREGPRVAPGLDQYALVFQHVEGSEPSPGWTDLWHAELGRFPLHLDRSGAPGDGRLVAIFTQGTL